MELWRESPVGRLEWNFCAILILSFKSLCFVIRLKKYLAGFWQCFVRRTYSREIQCTSSLITDTGKLSCARWVKYLDLETRVGHELVCVKLILTNKSVLEECRASILSIVKIKREHAYGKTQVWQFEQIKSKVFLGQKSISMLFLARAAKETTKPNYATCVEWFSLSSLCVRIWAHIQYNSFKSCESWPMQRRPLKNRSISNFFLRHHFSAGFAARFPLERSKLETTARGLLLAYFDSYCCVPFSFFIVILLGTIGNGSALYCSMQLFGNVRCFMEYSRNFVALLINHWLQTWTVF